MGARVYLESPVQNIVPEAGAVVVVNQERFNQNLLACIVSGAQAQSAERSMLPEICADTGTFTQERVSYQYIYVGAGANLCAYFSQHFNNLKVNS